MTPKEETFQGANGLKICLRSWQPEGIYQGHYHDLLNDLGKETVVADITSWIDKRLPA